MRAGKLDRPIVIQSPVITQDITGQDVSTWITFHSCYAQIMFMTGNEQFKAQGVHSNNQIKIAFRYKPGILPTMRVSFDGTIYRINSVIEIPRRKGTELLCEVWG